MRPRSSPVTEVHSGALRAFELSAGAGFLEEICTGLQSSPEVPKSDYHPEDKLSKKQVNLEWNLFSKQFKELALLVILYTIQGVPMGLSASIPFLLQGHVSYNELGIFSLVSLPFSFKVLWAPFVDSVYLSSVGRRRSWLIPVQLLSSILMFVGGSGYVDKWMGTASSSSASSNPPNVPALLFFFGSLYFLMATQDVAVDGWSLTLLSEENRVLSSACNAIGQTLGFSVAHVGFLALQDPGTCNRWIRSVPSNEGLVSLGSFLQFWGVVIAITTAFSAMFSEASDHDFKDSLSDEKFLPDAPDCELHLNVRQTYHMLGQLALLPPIVKLSIVLLTCRMAFGPIDAVTDLKLIEAGVKKEELAFFGPILLPIAMICPMLIGKLTGGQRPLRWFIRGWKLRLFMSWIWIGVIQITKFIFKNNPTHVVPMWFYPLLFIVSAVHSLSADIMFSSQMAFFAKIADPAVGGTYMTYLNTITNIGNKWPATVSLMTLDWCDFKILDGYVVQTLVFSILGLIWLKIFAVIIWQLETKKSEEWLVFKQKKN